jgi:hypothetical protein
VATGQPAWHIWLAPHQVVRTVHSGQLLLWLLGSLLLRHGSRTRRLRDHGAAVRPLLLPLRWLTAPFGAVC